MALFPFFVNIEGARGLIIGTGKHAEEKIQRLQPYGPCLTISPEGKFKESDLEPVPAFVIAAGDDREENHRISALCRERRIPVNVVDDQEYCDFIFRFNSTPAAGLAPLVHIPTDRFPWETRDGKIKSQYSWSSTTLTGILRSLHSAEIR